VLGNRPLQAGQHGFGPFDDLGSSTAYGNLSSFCGACCGGMATALDGRAVQAPSLEIWSFPTRKCATGLLLHCDKTLDDSRMRPLAFVDLKTCLFNLKQWSTRLVLALSPFREELD
jgi:hypothetical protein